MAWNQKQVSTLDNLKASPDTLYLSFAQGDDEVAS